MLEKIRDGLDKAANWARDNKDIAIVGGVVAAALLKSIVKRAGAKPVVVDYVPKD